MESLERYVDALARQDWADLADCVAENVWRTGPFRDDIRGRQAYVDFLTETVSALQNYEVKVSRLRPVGETSAIAELSEIMDLEGVRTECPEVLLFDFDADGRIVRIDIYIKTTSRNRSVSSS